MDYRIKEVDVFSVIGQEIKLTNSRSENINISTLFWQKFNKNLRLAYLSQSGNWLKYAFLERKDGTLYYFCAIPKKAIMPAGFILKEICPHKYLVFEHIGSMNKIYRTYEKIYQDILPNSGYKLMQNDFLHFERYDYRFHWNAENSIIEIWIPIQD